jgi:bifunctional non-homologous end joining protein LigD
MLLLPSDELPDGPGWLRELKLDGYRAVAFKSAGKPHLRSRNDNDFNQRYPAIVQALVHLPDETVIDGEVVALDGFRPAQLQYSSELRVVEGTRHPLRVRFDGA